MQLLVSVRDPTEALHALDGGADLIDAKEPLAGALGAVSLEDFSAIVAAVGTRRPVSAALGDFDDESAAEHVAGVFARAGAAFVKIGFVGVQCDRRLASVLTAAVAGAVAGGARLVAVAYADYEVAGTIQPDRILHAA